MSNTIDAILNVIKPYYSIIMIVIIAIIFIAAGFYGYKRYGKPILAEDETKDVANANRRNTVADLYFFHVKWCPHCRTALPIWQAFAKDYDKREVNGVTVKCHDIDCKDFKHNEIKINSFPKELNEIILKCLRVNKMEQELIQKAIKECKDYITENFDTTIDEIKFDKNK